MKTPPHKAKLLEHFFRGGRQLIATYIGLEGQPSHPEIERIYAIIAQARDCEILSLSHAGTDATTGYLVNGQRRFLVEGEGSDVPSFQEQRARLPFFLKCIPTIAFPNQAHIEPGTGAESEEVSGSREILIGRDASYHYTVDKQPAFLVASNR